MTNITKSNLKAQHSTQKRTDTNANLTEDEKVQSGDPPIYDFQKINLFHEL